MSVRLSFFAVSFFIMLMCGNAYALSGDIKGVGLIRLGVVDPVNSSPMESAVFYPSPDESVITTIGPYDIAATRNAKFAAGKYPLIIISHGNSGSLWGHHDLAVFLALSGNIVITLTHPNDNYKDSSGIGTTGTVYGRPLQISAALTAALESPLLAPHVEPEKIAFIGFSAGGHTGLILAGAKPDFKRLEAYCASRPADDSVCEAKGVIRNNRPDIFPEADPRIRAFVLIAPLSVLFPEETLKNIYTPILLYTGDKDMEVSAEQNTITLAGVLPLSEDLKIVSGAGHYTFLAPCSERLAKDMPELCKDGPGVDRKYVHQKISAEIVFFLNKVLNSS